MAAMIELALEAFVAQRNDEQSTLEADLFPHVSEAVQTYPAVGWYDDLLREAGRQYLSVYHAQGGKGDQPEPSVQDFVATLRETLDKTETPDKDTVHRISTWLATAILNSGTKAATAGEDDFVLQWVTMHDSSVRLAHAEADGQTRAPGDTFLIDDIPMAYPGDPSAPIDLWINCRCALRPVKRESLAASGVQSIELASAPADNVKHRVIVALPHPDDQVHKIGEDPKHLTLVNLGKQDENPDLDTEMVKQEMAHVAEESQPFTAKVKGVQPLGDDDAQVWMLEPSHAEAVRDRLLGHPETAAGHSQVEQFPKFIPHTTVGYPEVKDQKGFADHVEADFDANQVKEISYDRLALWDGEDHTECPLGQTQEEPMTETETEPSEAAASGLVPWHGVLAPEGEWSGDGRMFEEGSLSHRDLPLPLTWQKSTSEGHDGSITVADISGVKMFNGQMCAWGHMLPIPESDEVVGLMAHFGKYGVSVDADDAEMAFDEESGKVSFSRARVCSASIVSIPAFSQAYVKLGEPPAEWMDEVKAPVPGGSMRSQTPDEEMVAAINEAFVSDKPWSNFTQADYTDQQWKSACVMHVGDSMSKSDHKLPIKEPGGALNRNGVHAAAGRFNQTSGPAEAKAKAKASLRGAYKTLGEEVPDALKASAAVYTMGRGPGWLTNPEDTKRIHDYWTKPGEEGYAKVAWGTPGDFNRCRLEVGEEIAENSPEKVRFLNQICAQWHHDATGFWPGDAPAERAATLTPDGDPAPAVSLVASGGWCAPSEWFEDPMFAPNDGRMVQDVHGEWAAPGTVTDEGQVFGHLAGWKTCHTGYADVCVAPPRSASGYAYFLTGSVLTTNGSVPVGQLTVGGGHAPHGRSMRKALAHYDSTSAAVADVTVGEDDYGIWYAGWVRPSATAEQIHSLRAAALSGDWRAVNGQGDYELIAALAVNSPGFMVPRVGIKNGQQVSLVAAGVVQSPEPEPKFDTAEFAKAIAKEIRAQEKRREKMAQIKARVNGAK